MALAERDRRALIVFGSIVVVALAAYFLLLKPKGGDGTVSSGATSGPFTTGPIGTTAPPSVAPSTPPVTPRTPPPSGVPLGGKDPFSPIVNPSGGGGPPSTTTSTSGGPGTTTPGTSGPGTSTPATTGPGGTTTPSSTSTSSPTETPTNTVSPPPTSPSGPPHGTSTHVDGHEVTLIDIFTRDGVEKAQVQVDSTVHTVNEGQTFSDGFKLLAINGTCATFTRAGQEFVLCENPQK